MTPAPTQPRHEERPAPREGRMFPCAQCGAAMEFVPGAEALRCTHCGHTHPIPRDPSQVRENCFRTYFERRQPTAPLEGITGERRCDGCGAVNQIPAHVATDECPYCGTHLDNPVSKPQAVLAPEGVLPFAVPDSEAKRKFSEWVKSRWFAPNAFKRMADMGQINGVYLPYWTYDAMTWSHFTGARGDHYYVTVGSGKNQRRERRTRWTPAAGRVDHFFDDVLVCASATLPQKDAIALEPWDLPAMVPYKPDYLAGFRTERYQTDALESFSIARARMDEHIRSLIRQRIGGDVQRIDTVNTQIDGVTFKHVLLPLWLAAYRFRDRTFRVMVNARTGEVNGERPWSAWKIAFAILAGLIALGIAIRSGS